MKLLLAAIILTSSKSMGFININNIAIYYILLLICLNVFILFSFKNTPTHMVTNNIDCDLEEFDDMITGISVSPKIGGKFSWGIIKIWNSNGKNDISQILNKKILDSFQDISIKYKETKPES